MVAPPSTETSHPYTRWLEATLFLVYTSTGTSMVFDGQTSPFRWISNFGLKKFKFITYFCVAIKPGKLKKIFNYGNEIQGHKAKDRLESHPWLLGMWRTMLALIH